MIDELVNDDSTSNKANQNDQFFEESPIKNEKVEPIKPEINDDSYSNDSFAKDQKEESATESKNKRASNDPRVNKRKSSVSEIKTTELEVHVSQPIVADASKLPTKNINRASNDPRQKTVKSDHDENKIED